MNNIEEEPGLVGLVKSEAALLVKEEVVGDGRQDFAELQCGPSTSTIVGSMNEFDSFGYLGNILNVKKELGNIDIGPTVLQYMDTPGATNQKDVSVVKQEHTINHKNFNPILCAGVKEECLETVCRVQLMRLDTFQCGVCDAVYIDAHKLRQHVQDVHGPGPKISLDRHVKSSEISNGPQLCATVSSPVIYTCDYCHKTYASMQGLSYHTEVVHTKVRYRCSGCNKEYKGKHHLRRHMKRVHLKEKHETDTDDQRRNKASQSKQRAHSQVYRCDKCGKTYAWKASLLAHNKSLHSTESHECTRCNKIFPSKHYLYNHTSTAHSEQQYECAVCKKVYRSKQGLSAHVHRVHRPKGPGSSPVIYKCDYCHKIYASKQGLVNHIDVHTKVCYGCPECNKEYTRKLALQAHIRRVHFKAKHEGSSPVIYKCDYCHKIYASKQGLVNHIDVHTKVCYRCPECTKEYTGKLSLQAHIRRVHSKEKHEGTQIRTCKYCQKTFRTRTGLRLHTKNIHVAAHIHRCRRCNENFKSNEVLQQHNTSIHAQYKCQVCLKFYMTMYTLRYHFKKAHYSKDIQFQSDLHPHAMPDLCPSPDVTNAAASTSTQEHNVDVVKEEPADGEMELGPVVFQHMDCNYRPYKKEPQDGSGD